MASKILPNVLLVLSFILLALLFKDDFLVLAQDNHQQIDPLQPDLEASSSADTLNNPEATSAAEQAPLPAVVQEASDSADLTLDLVPAEEASPAAFTISYHLKEDTDLESPIEKLYLGAGDYLMKVVSRLPLQDTPHLIIDADGTLNDVEHGSTREISENVYVYERTIVADPASNGANAETIRVHDAFGLDGNIIDENSVEGAKFIDTVSPLLVLSDNQLDSIVKGKDRVLITAWFAEAGKIDEENKPKITIGDFVQEKEMIKKDSQTWVYVWEVPVTETTTAKVSVSAQDAAGNQTVSEDIHSYLIDNLFFLNFAQIPAPAQTCATAERIIRYYVSAIDVVVPVNGWGDFNPMGVTYALNNLEAVPNVTQIKDRDFKLYNSTDQSIPNKIQPLVLRANEGDCVEVILRNELDTAFGGIDPLTLEPIGPENNKRNVGMQISGLSYDPKDSAGAFIGNNPDTTVAPGFEKVYRWYAGRQGGYMFRDNSNLQWPQDTITKGLFGMLVVEPKGSTWRDSITGRNFLKSTSQNSFEYNDLSTIGQDGLGRNIYLGVGASIFADIHQQPGAPLPKGAMLLESVSGNDYRDYAMILHDEFEGITGPVAWDESGKTAFYGVPFYPATGIEDGTFLINYRSEPLRNRHAAWERHRGLVPVPGIGLVDGSRELVRETSEVRVTVTPPLVKLEFLGEEGEVIGEVTVDSEKMSVVLPNGRAFEPGDEFCGGGKFASDNGRDDDPAYNFYKCVGEEAHLQSWPFGDPAVAMPRAYWGDPIVIYAANADSHDTHTFHQHAHRWFLDPNQADISKLPIPENDIQKSTRLDVQGVGAMEVYKLVYEQGAGSVTGTAGDSIFHCHFYPHFAGGIWSAVRVFDKLKINFNDPSSIQATLDDGKLLSYPDGTDQAVLQPLPARVALFDTKNPDAQDHREKPPAGMANRMPMSPDADHPGYPGFVAGKFGQKALQPPMFVVDPATGQPIKDRATPTALETLASYDGIRPGATLVDPCKGVNGEFGIDRKPDRIYEPVAIQIPFIQNLKGGFFNPEQRAYVEKELVESVRGDPTLLQPYSFRANVGDCVQVQTTNNLQPDDETPTLGINDGVFHGPTNTTEISQHIHPVRFDQLGSDGTSVGWNYDISNRSGETAAYRWFVDVNVRTVFSHDHQFPTSHQQGGLWAAFINEPRDSTYLNPQTGLPLGPVLSSETYEQTSKKYPAENVKGVGTAANIIVNSPTQDTDGGISGGGIPAFREFVVHYSDFTPAFVTEPQNLRKALDDYKAGNKEAFFDPTLRVNPYNPPFEVDDFLADQGISTINYRVEPFQARVNPDNPLTTAIQKDPAYVFSSVIHGDPETEVFRAYAGDPVVIRLMDGAHEEHHNFEIHGHRWLHQPSNPLSVLTDNQASNIGEFFNFELIGNTRIGDKSLKRDNELAAGLPGDYLFASSAMSELWNGVWGIFRVENGKKDNLATLPNNTEPPLFENLGLLDQTINAVVPVPRVSEDLVEESSPCPPGAPRKSFDIAAISRPVTYNSKYTEVDPFGLMYVLEQDREAVQAGTKEAEPLVIRANEGDCIAVNLSNHLPDLTGLAVNTTVTLPDGTVSPTSIDPNTQQHFGEAQVNAAVKGLPDDPNFLFAKWPISNRTSLHPRLLKTVVSTGNGATVGYMPDQTIGPGEKITYLWYADTEVGSVLLEDFADPRSHKHHGLYAGLIIEPKGSQYLDPFDLSRQLKSGTSAVIHNASTGKLTREFVPFFATGLNLRKGDAIIADAEGVQGPGEVEHQPCSPPNALCEDVEQSGEVGINYRAERLANRVPFNLTGAHAGHPNEISFDPNTFKAFSSTDFGDPATPVFEAFAEDPTVFRFMFPGGNSNAHAVGLDGHSFRHEPNDPDTNIVSTVGSVTPGKVLNMFLLGGAGGERQATGDYLFGTRNNVEPSTLQGGLWGLFRVLAKEADAKTKPLVIPTSSPTPSHSSQTSSEDGSAAGEASPSPSHAASPTASPTPQAISEGVLGIVEESREQVEETAIPKVDEVLGVEKEQKKAQGLVTDWNRLIKISLALIAILAMMKFLSRKGKYSKLWNVSGRRRKTVK